MELVDAFNHLRKTYNDLTLMLVGPDDEELARDLQKITKSENRDFLIFSGLSNSPEKFMAAADILLAVIVRALEWQLWRLHPARCL